MIYTLQNIRSLRPREIRVKFRKRIYEGTIGGWSLDFPIVTFDDGKREEFAVETLVNCLNAGRPVTVL